MAVNRIYTRNGVQTNPGPKLDADIDQTNNYINAHETDTTTHGATGAKVVSTNSQTLTNKKLTGAVLDSSVLSVGYEALAAGSATIAVTTVFAEVTALAANVTVTIPTAEIIKPGRVFIIADGTGVAGTAFKIIVATQGAEIIEGEATIDIVESGGVLTLISNGTNLRIIP